MRALLLFLSVLIAATAAAQEPVFRTEASHALIMDYETGEILFSHNGETPMAPSSMSKLMTALMTFEALEEGSLSLDDELPVSEEAWRRGGAASGSSTMYLPVNTRARVDDLLRGMIVQSGNDACIVIAEALSGSEAAFAEDMTRRARELGLNSATFANATGWPHPDHRISAADLARIARIIIAEHPEYYPIYAEEEFTYNEIRQFNRNPTLGPVEGADGLKTGRTDEAGFGLVASAERDGVRRIVVFNGMESERARADEAERLLRAAFADFDVYTLAEAGDVLAQADVFMGVSETVALRLSEPARLGLHRRARADLIAEVVYEGPLTAPVRAGEPVGALVVTMPDGATRSFPLETAGTVERQGLLGRAMSALRAMVQAG